MKMYVKQTGISNGAIINNVIFKTQKQNQEIDNVILTLQKQQIKNSKITNETNNRLKNTEIKKYRSNCSKIVNTVNANTTLQNQIQEKEQVVSPKILIFGYSTKVDMQKVKQLFAKHFDANAIEFVKIEKHIDDLTGDYKDMKRKMVIVGQKLINNHYDCILCGPVPHKCNKFNYTDLSNMIDKNTTFTKQFLRDNFTISKLENAISEFCEFWKANHFKNCA
jgi:hypothetical protein